MNFLTADVKIDVDDKHLPQQLARARSAVTRTVNRIKASFRGMATSFKAAWDKIVRYAKYAAIALAGALILATKAALGQEQAIAKLGVVLKSTAYAAGLSRRELIAQAEALQKVTIYGDSTIQNMQALLLTFKGIQGITFERTVKAVLDVATAMGQDLQQSAIQVGKAINDPILGMTALRRVGIQFTEQQEEMIRTLVKSGKLFQAQGVILTELESQFGGMSQIIETGTGKLKQMWNALGDVAEVIGDALLPGIKDTSTGIKEWAEKNTERIGRWAKISVAYITYVKDVLVSFLLFMKTDWRAGLQFAADVGIKIWEAFATKLKTLVAAAAEDLYSALINAAGRAYAEVYTRIQRTISLGLLSSGTQPKLVFRGYGKRDEAMTAGAAGVREKLEGIVPPELQVKFDEASERLKQNLNAIGTAAEDAGQSFEEMNAQRMASEAAMGKSMVTNLEVITEKQKKAAKEIEAVWREMWLKQEEAAYHAMRAPIIKAEEEARNSAERRKRIAEDIASSMAHSWTNAIDQMMFEGKEFWDTMANMARELVRMIAQILIYRTIAMPIAYGIMGQPVPSAQHGGEVLKTGLAVIHKGETYSGVSGGGKGAVEIHVHNVPEGLTVSNAEVYEQLDRRIVTVSMQAIRTNYRFRKSLGIG